MQKKEIKKIFHLEGYILDKFEEQNNEIILHCHLQKNSFKLKNEVNKKINQKRNRLIAHSIFENKKVFIAIIQRRFYFLNIKRNFGNPYLKLKKGNK